MKSLTPAWIAAVAASLFVSGCASAPLPGKPAAIKVAMRDYRFDHAKTISAGAVVFKVGNEGKVDHQLLLVELPKNLVSLDAQLRGSRRRALRPVAFLADKKPGQSGIFAVDLAKGRYGLICFVTDPDGVQHTLKGMSSELSVT